MTQEIRKRIIIVSSAIVTLLLIVVFIVFFPLGAKKTQEQNGSVTSSSLSPTSTTTEITQPSGIVEKIKPIDTAVGKLPIVTDSYSLFYEYSDGNIFIANINAKEGTAEARAAITDIEKWFAEQKVDTKDIKIDYLFMK